MWIVCLVFSTIVLDRTQTLASDSTQTQGDGETMEEVFIEHDAAEQNNITQETIEPTINSTTDTDVDSSNDDDASFLAAILHLDNFLLGTGAIVAEQWILVTAFQLGAFKPPQLQVRVGSDSPHTGGQLLSVSKLYVHPMFYQFNNDVALLKTSQTIQLGSSANLIPVTTSTPGIGDTAAFFFWTDSGAVRSQAETLPVSECQVFYPDFELTESNVCLVMDQVLPYKVTLYGSPVVKNGSLVGLYMGLEADTFKPPLCLSLSPLVNWINLMVTNETDALRIFPLL